MAYVVSGFRAVRGLSWRKAALATTVPEVALHRIVATIAWEYLTPAARSTVETLLKDDPDQTLADASTWADRIRSDHSYDWVKPLQRPSSLRHALGSHVLRAVA